MDIGEVKEMLYKKLLHVEKQLYRDPVTDIVTEYSSKIFLSMFNASARRIEPEIIVITDEYVYEHGENALADEYNLVKIYSGTLEEIGDCGHSVSCIFLENSSVDELRLPLLKAELHIIGQSNDALIWRERYNIGDNRGVSPELIARLNAEERISRIYRGADGLAVFEYFGACLCAEPQRVGSKAEPYYYRFTAKERGN